jgi:lactoylglutathione lyase
MRFLHTMVRVHNLDQALDFYCHKLGLLESQRYENEAGRFTLIYLYAPSDAEAKHKQSPLIELTYNWDDEVYQGGRNFGHLAFEVDNIYQTCQNLIDKGVTSYFKKVIRCHPVSHGYQWKTKVVGSHYGF